jgi:hypothetical protein
VLGTGWEAFTMGGPPGAIGFGDVPMWPGDVYL